MKEKRTTWRDRKLGNRFSVRSFHISSWIVFTIVNTHLTSRTLYILKKNQLLLTCEHSAFQLQLDSLRYTHCCPLQLLQQNPGKAISLLSSLLEQNISPTKQRIFLRLLWISHCLGMFHIKISLILQDRGLSQPDCQGFGFHSSQNSWKSRSMCTRQYCIQPDHIWDLQIMRDAHHIPAMHAQGNLIHTEAWSVSLTYLGLQKASSQLCAHVPLCSCAGLRFYLHFPKNLQISEGKWCKSNTVCLAKCKDKSSSLNYVQTLKTKNSCFSPFTS